METKSIMQLQKKEGLGEPVKVKGAIHNIRDMGNITFLLIRTRDGIIQCVYEGKDTDALEVQKRRAEDCVCVGGILTENEKAPGGVEIRLDYLEVLSTTKAEMLPLPVSKWKLDTSLEAKLNYRSISLRNIKERAKFRIQEGLVRAFREYLYREGFTEIHTPKIAGKGAEGGANMFKLDYFHKSAVLSQSPQFYKQMMVGVFDRVFETAPAFRAEKHSTKRHLNEYISMDLEMGYIDGFEDIMKTEAGYLEYAVELLEKEYKKELEILKVRLPKVKDIPVVRFQEIKEEVSKAYGTTIKNPNDLEPEEELLIGKYAKEKWDADFVFVTHYPTKKRPFYAMEDPQNPNYTLSFDLLFKGLEITTGGQRIHNYDTLIEKIKKRGMEKEGMEAYLDTFYYGMPPHGGLGIGLERLTMRLLDEENVRETTLFPRDIKRLEP